MTASPSPKRVVALAALWTVVAATASLMALQLAFIVFASKGEWQSPDFYQVQVVQVEKDSTNAFTRDVDVTIDGEQDTITLPKSEAIALHSYDTLWVLDNYYATPIRPAQFRLTPGRVLAEYPEILLLLALLGLVRIRRSRWGIPDDPPPVPESQKKIFRDTFHQRATRHSTDTKPPEENSSTSASDAL